MTLTQEQLMELARKNGYAVGDDARSSDFVVSLDYLRELFTGHKLVPADAVVLTREERDAMVYATGCLSARIERAGQSVVVAADVIEAKHYRDLLLTAMQRTAIAQPQPKCKCSIANSRRDDRACAMFTVTDGGGYCCDTRISDNIRCGHSRACHASGGGHVGS